jgi:hypothetical protein
MRLTRLHARLSERFKSRHIIGGHRMELFGYEAALEALEANLAIQMAWFSD